MVGDLVIARPLLVVATAAGAAGDPALLVVRITTPAYGTEAETFPLARGGRYHIAIAAGQSNYQEYATYLCLYQMSLLERRTGSGVQESNWTR